MEFKRGKVQKIILMKSNRDINSLFREHKDMEIDPSPKAWRRLERKLDTHRRRGRRNVQRLMAMAAAFLLLIVIVLVLSMVVGPIHKDQMAYQDDTPVQLEDLVTTDLDLEAYRVVSFTHHHQDRMSAIEEGAPDRKLVPSGLSTEEAGLTDLPTEKKIAELSDFNWLTGQWQDEANGRHSIEKWQWVDAQNLRGEGLLLHKRDTLFREAILIEDNGEELVLWVQLTEQGRSFPFALTSYENGQAVFSNPHMTFPQEIRLERQDEQGFALVYVNTDVPGPDREQIAFLKQRNKISKQEVGRVMTRKSLW